jgi:hypothetical protein
LLARSFSTSALTAAAWAALFLARVSFATAAPPLIGLARGFSSSRCARPIIEFLLHPSRSPIVLVDIPAAHSFRNCASTAAVQNDVV